jgi:hypothetical protein
MLPKLQNGIKRGSTRRFRTLSVSSRQPVEFRAADAVARLLVRNLWVPSIYFEAPWPTTRNRVDILAIDRAGVGDVHVVEIHPHIEEALAKASRLLLIPAQFRWVAFIGSVTPAITRKASQAPLFSSQSMGRIGVIAVHFLSDLMPDQRRAGDATVVVPAERFPGSYYDEADRFVSKHKADIMFH